LENLEETEHLQDVALDDSSIKMQLNVVNQDPLISQNFLPDFADFIWKLLVKDPLEWLGGGKHNVLCIKRHPFFKVSSPTCYHTIIYLLLLVVKCVLSM
jgi:hypothetical protein